MQLGFFAILFFVLLILKLTGTIALSWLWVMAPLWAGFAFSFIVTVVTVMLVGHTVGSSKKR